MPSTFAGIEIGKRSLFAHTQSLYTVGHNISNADVEGYSRQRVELKAMDPIYMPQLNREETPGQLGQGVIVESVKRIKDMLLEARIVSETNAEGYWSTRDRYISMLEEIYLEPTDLSVRSLMDEFWVAWQELSLEPEERATRKVVLERGNTLLNGIHAQYQRLKTTSTMLNDDVILTVNRANVLIKNIANLNEQIVKVQALGDNPNDLLDRRDLLVNELSSLIDITISEKDPDEFTVYTGGMHIIQGRNYNLFESVFNPDNEGYTDVVWEGTDNLVDFRGGQILALLELRDGDVRSEIQKLDLMTINFVDLVNEVHSNAYNLSGETGVNFFNEIPFVINNIGNYDRNGDGEFDSTYLFRVSGTNQLNAKDHIGLSGVLTLPGPIEDVTIEYFPTDTVDDLINRINYSGAEVVTWLNRDGMFSVKGIPVADTDNPDFVIRQLEDSGQFLVGYSGLLRNSGPAGAFDWAQADQINQFVTENITVAPLPHPASWIEINDELLKDPGRIAASFEPGGSSPGDGSAALAIAQLRTKPVMVGDNMSFDDFFAKLVADIGSKGEQSEIELRTIIQVLMDLNEIKSSISGVNIDEELTNVIKFQHGYNAAARFISEVDKMLDVIINRMGV